MATISDFGIPGVASGILHPKTKQRWRCYFVNIGAGSPSIPLSHQMTTFKRPTLNFDKIELNRFNSRAYIGGKHTIEPINFTIEDDLAGTASRVLQQQLQVQQWLTGAAGPFLGAASEGSEYKFVTKLEMTDGGRGDETVERIICEGCWLENVDYDEVDYSSSEAVVINVTMSIDHFRQDLGGYSGANSALGGQG